MAGDERTNERTMQMEGVRTKTLPPKLTDRDLPENEYPPKKPIPDDPRRERKSSALEDIRVSWILTLGTGEKGERDMLSELSWCRRSRFSPGLLAKLRLSSLSLLRCCLGGGEEVIVICL